MLAGSTAVQIWLSIRHIRYIRARQAIVPAEFSSDIPLEAHRKAAAYTISKSRLGMVDLLVGMIVVLAFTTGGLLQHLSDLWSAVVGSTTYAHGLLLVASVAILGTIADLPVSLYRTFGIEARYGFNKTTFAMYLADLGKQLILGGVIGAPLLLLVLWVTDSMGEYWWLWVWLIWIGFNLLILMIYPTLIAPLFNKFTPLTDEDLRRRIDSLVHRCGFESRGVHVMDGSRRSSHGNAYFTGFGSNRRIVLFDTLIARLDASELEAVLAHELGHFARKHVLKRIAMLFAGSLLMLSVLGALRTMPWFYSAFGIDTTSTAMTLILFFMVLPPFIFSIQPLASLYSRKQEYEADAYAAQHSSADGLIHALVKLYKDNASTLTPDPLYSAFHDSHPPASLRIARLRASTSA